MMILSIALLMLSFIQKSVETSQEKHNHRLNSKYVSSKSDTTASFEHENDTSEKRLKFYIRPIRSENPCCSYKKYNSPKIIFDNSKNNIGGLFGGFSYVEAVLKKYKSDEEDKLTICYGCYNKHKISNAIDSNDVKKIIKAIKQNGALYKAEFFVTNNGDEKSFISLNLKDTKKSGILVRINDSYRIIKIGKQRQYDLLAKELVFIDLKSSLVEIFEISTNHVFTDKNYRLIDVLENLVSPDIAQSFNYTKNKNGFYVTDKTYDEKADYNSSENFEMNRPVSSISYDSVRSDEFATFNSKNIEPTKTWLSSYSKLLIFEFIVLFLIIGGIVLVWVYYKLYLYDKYKKEN